MKNIYLIVGPSGSGKTTLAETLEAQYGYRQVRSYTTRKPRSENEDGHIFVSDAEFDKLGPMLAFTEYDGHRYGVTGEIIGRCDTYVIDPDGVRYMKEHYAGNKGILVIQLEASEEECRSRMIQRGDSREKIERRLAQDAKSFNAPLNPDFHIHADGVKETAQAVSMFISFREAFDACIRILQIDPRCDSDHRLFMNTAQLKRLLGAEAINLSIYDVAWTGTRYISSLEEIFREFNRDDRPNASKMRSLSTSDIVEISNCAFDELNGLWYCNNVGWSRINTQTYTFEEEKE